MSASRMTILMRLDRAAGATILVVVLALSGCAAKVSPTTGVDGAEQQSVELLEETMSHINDVNWPSVPDPVATRCADGSSGVRFQYLVAVDTDGDSKALAESLQTFWRAQGLDVKPSEEDFGQYGVMYSATARASAKPWGSYEISSSGINLYVDSQCAEGNIRDFE